MRCGEVSRLLKRSWLLDVSLAFCIFVNYWLSNASLSTREIQVGMHLDQVYSIVGTPLTDQGYRAGSYPQGCFVFQIDFTPETSQSTSRWEYFLVAPSKWSISYRANDFPPDHPPVVGNKSLKVWVKDETSVWVWHDDRRLVTHMIWKSVTQMGGWQEVLSREVEKRKVLYEFFGFKGLLQ